MERRQSPFTTEHTPEARHEPQSSNIFTKYTVSQKQLCFIHINPIVTQNHVNDVNWPGQSQWEGPTLGRHLPSPHFISHQPGAPRNGPCLICIKLIAAAQLNLRQKTRRPDFSTPATGVELLAQKGNEGN